MNRPPDALVGTAPAEVIAHGLVDLRIGRLGMFLQECDGSHDLAGLAIAALRNLILNPRSLDGMDTVEREALNGENRRARDILYRRDA